MLEKLQDTANCLVSDLKMLKEGRWIPNDDSCQASIDNAELIANTMPQLISVLELVAAGNTEYDVLQAKASDILAKLQGDNHGDNMHA